MVDMSHANSAKDHNSQRDYAPFTNRRGPTARNSAHLRIRSAVEQIRSRERHRLSRRRHVAAALDDLGSEQAEILAVEIRIHLDPGRQAV